jgi:hypothetical protein
MPRPKLTRAQQIKGLERALASKKTPKQFRPSMEKRLKELKGK